MAQASWKLSFSFNLAISLPAISTVAFISVGETVDMLSVIDGAELLS
jgi:hypothetical protein